MSEASAAGAKTGGVNPWFIAVLVAVAAFMEVLDTTIANVALPYVAGGLGVSSDEASWVVTTYLVANAVALTSSTFLSRRMGRKRFFLLCLATFCVSSVLCGLSGSLNSLLFYRILQGLGGGGMVPVSQSILADAFPPEKRGQAFALFGVAVVVAPVVGPTLGGWLSDNWSWHWCFLINGPVGLAALALIQINLPADSQQQTERVKFDLVGFLLVATFLGALEIVLDRGLEDDWFTSGFIVMMTGVCIAAFLAMIPWELTRRDPIIDIGMVATRQFGACFLVMLGTGIVLLATTQALPLLVQSDFGYTATWAGLVLTPGGMVTMVMMFVVGPLSGRVQPRWLIAIGALVCAISMYGMTNVYADLDFWYLARSRLLLGVGLPLIFLPLLGAAYYGLPPSKTDQASALINAARNTGGSIGISMMSNIVAHREQFHQSRLSELLVPSLPSYQVGMQGLTQFFELTGSNASQAQGRAVGWIGQQLQAQASFLAYDDVFFALSLVALAAVPLALTLRTVKLGAAPKGAH